MGEVRRMLGRVGRSVGLAAGVLVFLVVLLVLALFSTWATVPMLAGLSWVLYRAARAERFPRVVAGRLVVGGHPTVVKDPAAVPTTRWTSSLLFIGQDGRRARIDDVPHTVARQVVQAVREGRSLTPRPRFEPAMAALVVTALCVSASFGPMVWGAVTGLSVVLPVLVVESPFLHSRSEPVAPDPWLTSSARGDLPLTARLLLVPAGRAEPIGMLLPPVCAVLVLLAPFNQPALAVLLTLGVCLLAGWAGLRHGTVDHARGSPTARVWASGRAEGPVATADTEDGLAIVWARPEGFVAAVWATPFVLAVLVSLSAWSVLAVLPYTFAMGPLLRLRLERDDLLLIDDGRTILVQGAARATFHIDDVRFVPTRRALRLELRDGRRFVLPATHPDELLTTLARLQRDPGALDDAASAALARLRALG